MGKKVISKGYTFEAKSWENDGDHSQTKFYTVDSETEARRINRICRELLPLIGNTMDGEGCEKVENYINKNKDLFSDVQNPTSYIDNLVYNLLGGSEDYDYRVLENFNITYSPEDVYLEEIKF
jgi:hypothetical protein